MAQQAYDQHWSVDDVSVPSRRLGRNAIGTEVRYQWGSVESRLWLYTWRAQACQASGDCHASAASSLGQTSSYQSERGLLHSSHVAVCCWWPFGARARTTLQQSTHDITKVWTSVAADTTVSICRIQCTPLKCMGSRLPRRYANKRNMQIGGVQWTAPLYRTPTLNINALC